MKLTFFFLLLNISVCTLSQEVVTKVVTKGTHPVIIDKNSPDARGNYTINQLTGKWQETSRRKRNNNSPEDFTDTLFYDFSGTNDVFTKDGVNMSLKGKASIGAGNELVAAADVYQIRSISNDQVVLDDREKYIHTFSRKQIFWYETFPTQTVVQASFTSPIKARSADLIGNWMVYRRDAEPGELANTSYLIKALNISRANGENLYGPVTFFHADKTDSLPGVLTIAGEKLNITTDTHSWQFNVYKANGTELVFGNSSIKYYCKQF